VRAAQHLGWDVDWVRGTAADAERYRACDGYLFLTEGQVDTNIPINPKAFYILHNVDFSRYASIPLLNKLVLQVYTEDVHKYSVVPLENTRYEFWGETSNTFYMPWATDILPDEINENMKLISTDRPHSAVFLGTVGGGIFGNINEIRPFMEECRRNGWHMDVLTSTAIPQDSSIKALQARSIAPSIVGTWQKEKGYIPCRIFKTISYGLLGCTNSVQAYNVVEGLAIFDADEASLARKTIEIVNTEEGRDLLRRSMECVRDKHTYLNRIASIQKVFMLKKGM